MYYHVYEHEQGLSGRHILNSPSWHARSSRHRNRISYTLVVPLLGMLGLHPMPSTVLMLSAVLNLFDISTVTAISPKLKRY